MSAEVNFDGLVGPTHNYSGLAFGNVASSLHEGATSSPRQAALQGLEKMWALHQMGMSQGVLPPQERPSISLLKRLGFSGINDGEILGKAAREAPNLLASSASAASMWVANAATISPGPDTVDGKTHFTPANLSSMLHRSIEAETTGKVLEAIFSGADYVHHPALPATPKFSDEGAANHTRLSASYAEAGVGLFVYGGSSQSPVAPRKYPARQTLEACQAIARSHGLRPGKAVFAQQNPDAIDAGVFHNDVIAVGNLDVLFYHEKAFLDTQRLRDELDQAASFPLHYIEVPETAVALDDAVRSYLFNSQLVTPSGARGATLIVPTECKETESVRSYLEQLPQEHGVIAEVRYFDLRQSMNNGGGPACLRLRVVMNESQQQALRCKVLLDESLYSQLKQWVQTHYRDELAPKDLADPSLLNECRTALDELSQIMGLGSVYEFQR